MRTTNFSCRTSAEFAAQTKVLAHAMGQSMAGYAREAVSEKNKRTMNTRMVFLSKQLSTRHWIENQMMDASAGDGLVQG